MIKKENLTKVKPGVYINNKDSFYWEKILEIEPNNPEAMHQVGLNTEKKAKIMLQKFKETKDKKYLTKYYEKIDDALTLIVEAWEGHGHCPAFYSYNRIVEEKRDTKKEIKDIPTERISKKELFIFAFFLVALIAISISIGAFAAEKIISSIAH